jgi:hypothetical protein
LQNKHEIEPDIEKITGFAGARFSECVGESKRQKTVDNPLRKLFESESSEMFEGSESFTWISRD